MRATRELFQATSPFTLSLIITIIFARRRRLDGRRGAGGVRGGSRSPGGRRRSRWPFQGRQPGDFIGAPKQSYVPLERRDANTNLAKLSDCQKSTPIHMVDLNCSCQAAPFMWRLHADCWRASFGGAGGLQCLMAATATSIIFASHPAPRSFQSLLRFGSFSFHLVRPNLN